MANSTRRVNSRSDQYSRQLYVEGSAVRKLNAEPARKQPNQKPAHEVSKKTQKNRAKAMQMSPSYVVFLMVISVVTLCVCVQFLQMKSQLTTQTQTIEKKESQLSRLKADNDALYNTVMASVDIEYVKNTAINKLGMNYPTQDQIVYFDTAGNSYVRQYQDVPDIK